MFKNYIAEWLVQFPTQPDEMCDEFCVFNPRRLYNRAASDEIADIEEDHVIYR
jgi:hypothetical protein